MKLDLKTTRISFPTEAQAMLFFFMSTRNWKYLKTKYDVMIWDSDYVRQYYSRSNCQHPMSVNIKFTLSDSAHLKNRLVEAIRPYYTMRLVTPVLFPSRFHSSFLLPYANFLYYTTRWVKARAGCVFSRVLERLRLPKDVTQRIMYYRL